MTPANVSATMKSAAKAVAAERKGAGHYILTDTGWKHIPWPGG